MLTSQLSSQNRPEQKVEKKFDEAKVAEQALWAKDSLQNLPKHEAAEKFNPRTVAEQSQWVSVVCKLGIFLRNHNVKTFSEI